MKNKPTCLTASFALLLGTGLFAEISSLAGQGPQPSICTRSCWGARSPGGIGYMGALSRAIIHHTADSGHYNTTSATTSRSNVRGVQNYHMDVNGWSDIGYHFLVDKLGNIFEGRYGSMGSLPQGAHDGVNYNSFGFTAMGYFHSPYNNSANETLRDALYDVIAWRMPSSWSPYGSGSYGGNTVGTLDGHRAALATACPGDKLYAYITSSYNGGEAREEVEGRKSGNVGNTTPSNIYVFGRGSGGGCGIRQWNSTSGWGSWWSLGGNIVGGPDGYSRGPDHVGVVARSASDNSIQARYWTSGGGWATWSNLGGDMTSDPSACARNSNKWHVAARGQDNAVWIKTYTDGQGWASWYSVGGDIDGAPDLYSKSGEHLGVVALFGSTIKAKIWTADEGWRSYWTDLGGSMDSAPSAVVRGATKVHVFARHTSGNCYVKTYTEGEGWADWYSIGAPPGGMVNAPDAYSRGPSNVGVFVRTGNNRCYKKNWSTSGGWGSWEDIGQPDGGLTSSPGAITR